jgi:ABC-2 type transport system ATP-binding protein
MSEMIKAEGLQKKYNDRIVINIPELTIDKGELVCLVGNNGAGKTTLFKLFLDLILPDAGNAFLDGNNVKLTEMWKFKTASYLGESFLLDYLTPEEYFIFLANLKDIKKHEIEETLSYFIDFFNDEILNKKKLIRDFSKGNIQKIGIVSCFILKPEIVFLDEPFSNIDPTSKLILNRMLKKYAEDGTTIFLSSHELSMVEELNTRVVLMNEGSLIKDSKDHKNNISEIKSFFNLSKSVMN